VIPAGQRQKIAVISTRHGIDLRGSIADRGMWGGPRHCQRGRRRPALKPLDEYPHVSTIYRLTFGFYGFKFEV
jgi:hypothetical protein